MNNFDIDKIKKIPLFFIIGRARSGTTLLRTMFDAHPNVSIPIESPLIIHMLDKYGDIGYWTKGRLLEFYDDLLVVKDFQKWTIDREKLKTAILACEGQNSYQTIIKVIYWNFSSIFKKEEIKLLGDKNPVYSVSIKKVFRLFPEAKYIHLTRDYRDHILSMVRTKVYTSNVLFLAFRWKFSAKLLKELKKQRQKSFYTIKYEDLVKDTKFHLQKICDFLGIEFIPQVINYHKETEQYFENELKHTLEDHHKKVFKPIDASRIDIWKTEMKDKDIRIADLIVGKYAEEAGYQRKYKDKNVPLYLKLLPGIIYEKAVYSFKRTIDRFPYKMKTYIKNNSPKVSEIITNIGK
ncbi:MAG: sulfotransferase [Bacteroidetes bacterium]|jgi:hypothetical protein|nr:sulfotransferase [Bacteroidota bacterium]MBT6686692.1 sulfotransferase [Bacteroidota bacterium]MBT7141830.1 sulfotransferase [Bacteroidota bacterium]MBT7490679.1 sulfotransferase [Bacteroidota bacterium]